MAGYVPTITVPSITESELTIFFKEIRFTLLPQHERASNKDQIHNALCDALRRTRGKISQQAEIALAHALIDSQF